MPYESDSTIPSEPMNVHWLCEPRPGFGHLEADEHLDDDAIAHDHLGQTAPALVRVAGEVADLREDDLDLGVGEPAQRIEQVDAHVQPRAALAGLVRPAVVVRQVRDH